MPNVFTKLLERVYPNSAWNLEGRGAALESANRLAFRDGLKIYWLTVKSDGTLKGGIVIDVDTMNSTNPSGSNEARDKRIERACRVQKFLADEGFPCAIVEDGRSLKHL